MANSIKQTKVLFEGFRRFAIREAEAEKPAEGGEIVRIFDFDGTLFEPQDEFFKNPLWRALLKSADYKKLMAIGKQSTNPEVLSKLKETESDGKKIKSYVVSLVGSTGFPISAYKLIDLALKNDQGLNQFIQRIDKESEFEKAKNTVEATGSQDPLRAFFKKYTRLKDIILDKSTEEIQALRKKINFYDEYKIAKNKEEQSAIKQKYGVKQYQPSFDLENAKKTLQEFEEATSNKESVDSLDNERLVAIQKQLIEEFLKKHSANVVRVDVKSSLAERTSEEQGYELIKGTSGKRPLVQKIASENKDAYFEIYDNLQQSLNDMMVGVTNVIAPTEEKKSSLVVQGKLKRFLVGQDGSIQDLSLARTTTTKDETPEQAAQRETTGSQRKFDQIKRKLFDDFYVLLTGGSKGRPSGEKQKAFSDGLNTWMSNEENSKKYLDLIKVLKAMLFSDEKPSTTTSQALKLREEEFNTSEKIFRLNSLLDEFDSSGAKQKLIDDIKNRMPKKIAVEPTEQPEVQKTPPAESIYEELDRLLSNKKYSFHITTKK